MVTSKGRSLQEALGRADHAIGAEFYLEASWIMYSLLEDRTDSALKKTGGLKKGMLGVKLDVLKKRSQPGTALWAAMLENTVLDYVVAWKNERNELMHQMLHAPRSWDELNREAQVLATDGRPLVAAFANAVTRLRRRQRT